MSNMRCDHCGAEVTNGLALCELSQRFADDALTYLPIYFRNLSRWRPGRAGSRPVPGSRVLYDGAVKGDGTGDRISDTLDATANMLTTRARMLADDRGRRIGRLLDRLTEARDERSTVEAMLGRARTVVEKWDVVGDGANGVLDQFRRELTRALIERNHP